MIIKTVTLIKGDGIGPEVMSSAQKIIDSLNLPIQWETFDVNPHAQTTKDMLSKACYDSIEKNKCYLKGPITTPVGIGNRSINVFLRQYYDLHANIRPIKPIVINKQQKNNAFNFVIFRENTEGLYAGIETSIDENKVIAKKIVTRNATEKIATSAFEYAQKNNKHKVTIVHKANILKLSDGFFLKVCQEIAKKYPHIKCETMIVDNCAMQLVMNPDQFEVILTTNLYGDILSDLGAGLIGGLGLTPSANRGMEYACFEAVHGSAPDIAGKNIANPTAMILSSCLMLDFLGYKYESDSVKKALYKTINEDFVMTPDLGGKNTTDAFTDQVINNIKNNV